MAAALLFFGATTKVIGGCYKNDSCNVSSYADCTGWQGKAGDSDPNGFSSASYSCGKSTINQSNGVCGPVAVLASSCQQ